MSQPDSAEVRRIEAGLSAAQLETVACAWPYPDYHRNGEQVSLCPVWRNDSSRRALERKGLVASKADGGPRLTPLGLAVRAHLENSK